MKKYVSLFVYISVLIFGLFVFTYKPSTQTEVPEIESATHETSEQQIDEPQVIQPQTQNVTVKNGDTFVSILETIGVDEEETTEIEDTYKKVYNLDNLQIGQVFSISSLVDVATNKTEVVKIVTEPEKGYRYILENNIPEFYQTLQPKFNNDKMQIQNSKLNEKAIMVEKGDNFIGILKRMGLGYENATNLYKAYKKVYDARNAKIGQIFYFSLSDYEQTILKITTEPVSGTRYVVERLENGEYISHIEQGELKNEIKVISGVINGTVVGSMRAVDVPQNIVGNFINIFSYNVDFRRDVRSGDKFKVAYTRKLAPDGNVVRTGDVIYAELTLGKTKTALYRFNDSSETVKYYDEQGLGVKKTLDRKPLEFKKARIFSKFNQKISGIVYEAPMDTKVYAAADGIITAAKRVNSYGNYITIRHNSEYSTGYGYLQSYAKGIQPGARVVQGQVIAYVGSIDSSSSGLLFEVIKNGKKIDPLKIKGAIGENLQGEKLKEFKEIVAEIKAFIDENKPIQNPKIYEFSRKNWKYKAYIEKDKNVEILEDLQRRLSRNVMQAIDTIEIKIDNDKMYSATAYIKHGYEYGYKNIAYQIVQEILNILIAEGRSPFHEHTSVFVYVSQKVKGVTGQNMVNPFGSAHYDYTNDTIQWEDWKRHIFF